MAAPNVPETCEECGFDGSRWTRQDAVETVAIAASLVRVAVEGLLPREPDADPGNQRPDQATWSIGEYVEHLTRVFGQVVRGCELAVSSPGIAVEEPSEPSFDLTPGRVDLVAALDAFADGASAASRFFRKLPASDWNAHIQVGEMRFDADVAVVHLCHDLMHHLVDIANIRRVVEPVFEPRSASITQVSASGGGVPKLSVGSVELDAGGVVGDVQTARKHHGRPWQAVCLYSADVIADLVAEGHPIAAGSAGENLTLAGMNWAAMRPGLIIRAGDVRLRISAPAIPCSKNNRWFSDGDSNRMSHELHPGSSRWYAAVETGGRLNEGDVVTVSTEA